MDPLATSNDKDNEDESGEESSRDADDTESGFANADSDDEDKKFDPSQIARSEEIIVVSA